MFRVRFFTTTNAGYKHLRKWGKTLMSERKAEILDSMEQEGIEFKGMYVMRMRKNYYLVADSQYGHSMRSSPAKSAINQECHRIQKTWLKPIKDKWHLPNLKNLKPVHELDVPD
jgi:hypothetical protein